MNRGLDEPCAILDDFENEIIGVKTFCGYPATELLIPKIGKKNTIACGFMGQLSI